MSRVAPAVILGEDFRDLDSRVILRTAWHVEQLILLQSVTSHAHMGHGIFHGRKYENTTEDDTARALRLDPTIVKADRQELIDEVKNYAKRAIEGTADSVLCNEDGEPLLRIGTFRYLQVDPKGVLQGIYLGGLRDEPEVRSEAERRYGVRIGWGKCYLVDKRVMHEMHLSGDVLAQQAHLDEIEDFKKSGLIVEETGQDIAYMYIRQHTGPGASDDAAVVIAGKLYGPSVAAGVFLADAVDTLEKYATQNADQDSDIAHYIEGSYRELGMELDEACLLTYLSAAPEGREHEIPDSSLRGLLEIDRKYDLCPLESHLLYSAGKVTDEIELDHGQSTTWEFYRYIEGRLAEHNKA
jgi:hypothetical protein